MLPSGAFAAGRDVPALVGQLKSADPALRSKARYELAAMGGGGVPALLDALERGESQVEIILVLNSIKDPRAAGPLAGLLGTGDEETARAVQTALFSLGKASVPHLLKALEDPRRAAAAAGVLSSLEDPDSYGRLRKLLSHENPATRRCAAAVERAWLDPEAREAMHALLSDPDAPVRREASGYFVGLDRGLDREKAGILLADGDAGVRGDALRIIIRERMDGEYEAVSRMLASDPDPEVRRLAAEALFRCHPAKACGPLSAALTDRDAPVASHAADCIGELRCKEASSALVRLFAGGRLSDERVASAARALAAIGADYDPGILLMYINWNNLHVVKAVIGAWEVCPRPLTPAIREALKNYIGMKVDGRYKERAARLAEKIY